MTLPSNQCSFVKTAAWATSQKKYQCRTCCLTGDLGICEVCARKCHAGHNVVEVKSIAKFACDCGGECGKHSCKCIPNNTVCTSKRLGPNTALQHVWGCRTCGIMGEFGICNVCAERCHAGHQLVDRGVWSSFSCDCGVGSSRTPCICKTRASTPAAGSGARGVLRAGSPQVSPRLLSPAAGMRMAPTFAEPPLLAPRPEEPLEPPAPSFRNDTVALPAGISDALAADLPPEQPEQAGSVRPRKKNRPHVTFVGI